MKKLTALLLALAIVFVFAACGKNGGANPDPGKTTEPDSSETTTEEAVEKGTPVEMGGSIENDLFKMTFESMEIVPEYSYKPSEHFTMKLPSEDGYKMLLVKGHMENKGAEAISTYNFALSSTVNETYKFDGNKTELWFERSSHSELDPLTDVAFCLFVNIPEKLADTFETATFTLNFNKDLSGVKTIYSSDGTSSIEADCTYTLTSGLT